MPERHRKDDLYQVLFPRMDTAENAVFIFEEPRPFSSDLRCENRLAVLVRLLLLEDLGPCQRRREDLVRDVIRGRRWFTISSETSLENGVSGVSD